LLLSDKPVQDRMVNPSGVQQVPVALLVSLDGW
jgi:hypothetical protein